MRTWLVHQWCESIKPEPDGMKWEEVDAPEPGPGEVRVRNRAAALNFFDILQIQGKYQVKPPFPFTPGAEISGEIDAVGEGVIAWQPGDAVIGLPSGGGFGQQTVVEASKTFRLPPGMDWAQAAAMPIVYHTSWFALRDRVGLDVKDVLLVHAGASGVGMSAIQIAKALGTRVVIATAGSPEKRKFARRQGADYVLDYTSDSWADDVKELTAGRGADVIYDPIGGDIFDLSTKCIAPFGRIVVIGFASGRIPSVALNRVLLKNISIVGVFWGGHVKANPAYAAETQAALERLWLEGEIHPEVSSTCPLEQLPEAMQALAARKVLGKAVLLA